MKKISFVFFSILFTAVFFSGLVFSINHDNRNKVFKNFSSAKKAIYKNLDARKTFYCNCSFDSKNIVDIKNCGYTPRKDTKRANRVEMEHVVPASKLCGKTREWAEGSPKCVNSKGKNYKGRECASKHNESCRAAYNDLHNLRPAIGEVNNDRQDFSFGEVSGKKSPYGACHFVIHNKIADPPDNIQGDIARIYLHMNQSYPELEILSDEEISFFRKWSINDPVTKEECLYNNKLLNLQKTTNHFVQNECRAKFP
jgi:deoxyribonuclease-1